MGIRVHKQHATRHMPLKCTPDSQLPPTTRTHPHATLSVAFFNNKLWLSGGQSSAGVQGDIFVSNRGIIWKQVCLFHAS